MSLDAESVIEFLTKRIEEDDARAREMIATGRFPESMDDVYVWGERVLREVEVRRWIIEMFTLLMTSARDCSLDEESRRAASAASGGLWLVMLSMTDIYGDHDEHNPVWSHHRQVMKGVES